MPCSDGGPTVDDYDYLSRRVDEVTQMLCWLCNNVDRKIIKKNPVLYSWFEAHEMADKARKKHEQEQKERNRLREQGLSKLTKEERIALGLN
jgi:hypothetical protein